MPRHRLTLTEVRHRILEQTTVFKPEDIIPVPCHPDSLAMGYALKLAGNVTPLTSMIPPEVLINGAANTIIYEQDSGIRAHLAQHPELLAKAAANQIKKGLFNSSQPINPHNAGQYAPGSPVMPAADARAQGSDLPEPVSHPDCAVHRRRQL